MIKPENVPETVWRAAMSAYHKTLRKNPAMAWQEAVVAMLSAWPSASTTYDPREFVVWPKTMMNLPMPWAESNGEPTTEHHRWVDRQYKNAERIFDNDKA